MSNLVYVAAVLALVTILACQREERGAQKRIREPSRPLPVVPKDGTRRAVQPWDAYRTGRIDTRVLDVPAEVRKGVFRHPEKYVGRLVEFLVQGARDDFHRAKLLHDWVAENIRYDVKGFFSGDHAGGGGFADTLRKGSSVCEGYAGLFEHMCSLAGLECAKISGYGRGYGYRVFDTEDPAKSNHAWNAVKVQGRWHLMDITWDAGHIDDSHEYAKTYRTDFLFLEPEKFLCTHFPTDSKWQLLDRPVGKQEFLDLPYLRGEFFGYGLELAGPATQVSQAGDSASLDLLAPQDVLLMAQLADPHDGEQTRRTFIRRIQGAARVDALFPESGQWKLRLFARTSSDPEPNRYTWVADLGYEAAAGTDSRFPETFGTYGQIGCNLIEPQFSPLPVGEPLRFSVDVPGVAGVAVVQGEAWTKLQRTTGDNWTGTATSSSSQPLKVLVQLRADDSQWQGILQYE